jgi:acetate kinase
MATRSGSVDPGALLHLLRSGLLSADELEQALEHESGLAALGGLGDPLARAVYTYRIAGAIGTMAIALDGLDGLVFTAGVGENSAVVRSDVCARLGFLGVEVDPEANQRGGPELAPAGSAVRVVVVPAREDVIAARAVRALLSK